MQDEKRKVAFVKNIDGKYRGEARLYRTDSGYVVASSVHYDLGFGVDEPGLGVISEVMVFEADDEGNVTSWDELGAAYPAGEFAAALEDAGFEEDC